jgi:hypothetical protein
MMKKIELLSDPNLETGFHLLGINPVIDQRNFVRKLDYGGNAKMSSRVIWQMAQWWTPYNVKDAIFIKNNHSYTYKTASRLIQNIPVDQGFMRMNLEGSKEYLGKTRNSQNDPWAHLLIEQDFESSVSIDSLEALEVSLTFSIEEVIDKNGEAYDSSLHAAQLLWYLVIADKSNPNQQQYGKYENFFWFGIPIYDSRLDTIPSSMHVDQGGIGTTGRLIYSMSNASYIHEKIEMNKIYTIHLDILPEIKKAKKYALENGYLMSKDDSNFQIGYMNFGWELPGAFDVKSWIKNMSIKAVKK